MENISSMYILYMFKTNSVEITLVLKDLNNFTDNLYGIILSLYILFLFSFKKAYIDSKDFIDFSFIKIFINSSKVSFGECSFSTSIFYYI